MCEIKQCLKKYMFQMNTNSSRWCTSEKMAFLLVMSSQLPLGCTSMKVANPLGTSKKKHKMCAMYWVIANLPAKYRASLNSIQLALICNTAAVK